MSHGDRIDELPPGFRVLARTANSPFAAMGRDDLFGLQFHPEVVHTQHGKEIIRNFLYDVCGCEGDWPPATFVADAVERIRAAGRRRARAICALSRRRRFGGRGGADPPARSATG